MLYIIGDHQDIFNKEGVKKNVKKNEKKYCQKKDLKKLKKIFIFQMILMLIW